MVSENVARIIAKISGDGNVYKNQVMYFNTCDVLLDEFENDIRIVFGNVPMTKGRMSSGTKYVRFNDKKMIEKLKEYLSSYNSFYIFIPKEVLNSEENVLKEYIRAFYDDEGCASLRLNQRTREWKRNITLASNSFKMLSQVKIILKKFNITTNTIIRNRANSDYDKSFVLSITGKDNFILFHKKIGFKHPRKASMLDLIIRSYGATSKNQLEFNKIKKEKKKLVVPKI
ncbi:hypothetical protein HYU22_04935 [Candidatus Woesearchaeota archaeon]|nr:hypothetical protein [Candidatus Woesearchaeota archaeon]